MTPTRREFLGTGAAALLAACARPVSEPAPDWTDVGVPVFPISLGQWSLHRAIRSGQLDPLDFPRFARERIRVDAVEYVNTLLGDVARDEAWLTELRRRADDAGVRSLLILVDVEERLGAAEPARRALAVDVHRRWLEAAKLLGCDGIRVNAYGVGTSEEQQWRCAEGLYRLCDLAEPLGMHVLVENHDEHSRRAGWLAGLIRIVGHPHLGSLPDFGNWEPGTDRYAAVAELMPWARAVSAKAHDFDAAGNETSTDYERMLRVVAAGGYTGYLGVEYEGDRLSEEAGVRATIDLIRRVSPAD